MKRQPDIQVRKMTNHRGKPAWWWRCRIHPRARGFHNTDRWTDYWRRSRGMEPDAHPWQRCMDGAVQHWHKYHSECTCAVTHPPLMSRESRRDVPESELHPQIGHTQ